MAEVKQEPVDVQVQQKPPDLTNMSSSVLVKDEGKAMDKHTLSAVLQFLRKNNLKGTEDLLRKEANVQEGDDGDTGSSNDQEVSSVLSAYSSEGDPSLYKDYYSGLERFVEGSLDNHKSELAQILYPVFVHMYLELVYNDHEMQAKSFFDDFSKDQEEYHQDDLQRLAMVTKKEHMKHNELMINFRGRDNCWSIVLQGHKEFHAMLEFAHLLIRTSKYVIRMSRDSYQSLKRHLQDRQNHGVLTIVQEHMFVDVFDGMPRSKQQIVATAGAMGGEAKREANKSKVFYGLLKEPEINLPHADGDESMEGEDKPKKKKVKKDSTAAKSKKPDPNAPPQNRIPLLEMKDSDKMEKRIAMRELSKRVRLSPDCLPSICFYTFLHAYQGLTAVDISDDSSLLAAGFADSVLRIWTLTPKKLRNMKSSLDLGYLDIEADDILERIMDDRTASDCRTLHGHSGAIYSTSFSPDRNFVLSSSEDGTVRLWSLYTFSNLVCYKGHNYPVWDVQFGPYGHYFATCGMDRTVRLWSTEHYQPLRIFAGHYSGVDCIKFHPNSNYIASGSSDRTVRLWDVSNGKCVRIMTGHKGSIHALAFNPKGHCLASTGEDKRVLIWELRHGCLVGELKGHTDTVYSLCFCRDGHLLASGGSDNCVKLWDIKKVFSEVDSDDMANTPQIVQSDKSNILLGSYPTRHSPVHDLHFTRRNLLMSTGPYLPVQTTATTTTLTPATTSTTTAPTTTTPPPFASPVPH